MSTKIEWTADPVTGEMGKTWNFLRGCTRKNAECDRCYAMHQSHRGLQVFDAGLTKLRPKDSSRPGVDWTGKIAVLPERLGLPLRWKKPRYVFVNSMSDLFHDGVPFEVIAAAFGVIAATPRHTYQVLTKRPQRAAEFFAWLREPMLTMEAAANSMLGPKMRLALIGVGKQVAWPLLNVHLGVSAGRQETADEKIPILLELPAAVRWVSVEPMLGPVDLSVWIDRLDWVVVGGESGHGARPCDIEWIRALVKQCQKSGTPVFVKQLGANPWEGTVAHTLIVEPSRDLGGGAWSVPRRASMRDKKGGDPTEWPADLRVRERPAR